MLQGGLEVTEGRHGEQGLARARQRARAGREQHFADYRLRIGPEVDPSRARSVARAAWVSYYDAKPAAPTAGELFKSVYREGKFLVLSDKEPDAQAASSDRKAFEITRVVILTVAQGDGTSRTKQSTRSGPSRTACLWRARDAA